MRILLFLLIISTILIACNSPEKGPNGVTYKSAVAYNDYIVGRQSTLLKKIMKFAEVAQMDLDSANLMLDGFVKDADGMIGDIKGMPSYKKDSAFRNAAISSFTFYRKAFDDYYRDIISIRKEGAEDAEAQLNELLEKLTAEEDRHDKTFHNAQRNFAEKNKMQLKDNEIQKKIEDFKEEQ